MMLVDAPARQNASAMQTSVCSRSNSGGVLLNGSSRFGLQLKKTSKRARFHMPGISAHFAPFPVPAQARRSLPKLKLRIKSL
jgi:hypothetical protein